MKQTNDLEKLFSTRKVWRASHRLPQKDKGIDSGFSQLNHQLPDKGWPTSGLTELLCDQVGLGELSLLSPALAQLSQQAGWVVWVDPPYIPYPPALAQQGIDLRRIVLLQTQSQAEQLWALETLLKADYCHAALFWPKRYSPKALRRLHIAADQGKSWGIAFRPLASQAHASPAPLRIRLGRPQQNTHAGLQIDIIKRPGKWASDAFSVPIQQHLHQNQAYSANFHQYQPADQVDQQEISHHRIGKNPGDILPLEEKATQGSSKPGSPL